MRRVVGASLVVFGIVASAIHAASELALVRLKRNAQTGKKRRIDLPRPCAGARSRFCGAAALERGGTSASRAAAVRKHRTSTWFQRLPRSPGNHPRSQPEDDQARARRERFAPQFRSSTAARPVRNLPDYRARRVSVRLNHPNRLTSYWKRFQLDQHSAQLPVKTTFFPSAPSLQSRRISLVLPRFLRIWS